MCDVEHNLLGYEVHEFRRSDVAGDKAGGGIAIWCRQHDGLVFSKHSPELPDPSMSFVNNERVWMTVTSNKRKTAICTLYAACQHPDNRHLEWNRQLYDQILREQAELRSKGYRVLFNGDMNGHVGDTLGEGIPGNIHPINPNGRLFLDFLELSDCVHINGAL